MSLPLKKNDWLQSPDNEFTIISDVSCNRHGHPDDSFYHTWRAEAHYSDDSDRKVYLKIVEKNSRMYQSLLRESMFKIRFPYIEYIEDSFEMELGPEGDEKVFFVVVAEFVKGKTLGNTIQEWDILNKTSLDDDEKTLFRMILQLLYAVDTYSSRRLGQDCMTHRDLKPSNLMFNKDEQRLVVIDFDWSHIPENDSILERQEHGIPTCGTKGYGDPRNWIHEKGNIVHSDIKMDIYSLAMLIFFIMTGSDYFNTPEEKDTYTTSKGYELAYIFNPEKIPARHPFRDKKFEPVRKIIQKAMAPVENRYASVRDMIKDFESFLKGYYNTNEYAEICTFDELLDVPRNIGFKDENYIVCRYYDIEKRAWKDIRLNNHQSCIMKQNEVPVLSVYNRNGNLVCYPYHADTNEVRESDDTVVISKSEPVKFICNSGIFDVMRISCNFNN